MPPESGIELSIVVALVSGAKQRLRTCLEALEAQRFDGMEIIVPYDDPVADVVELSAEFPKVSFAHAKGLDTTAARAGASREHHDSIRTLGLRHARGRVVAMLEDVGRADTGWCRGLLDALERHPKAGAVGGGIGCGSRRLLNRAVCLSDFWRYQLPVPEATSPFASDANIAYRSEALHALRDVWEGDFHETVVNGALLERGYELWLDPSATIFQERGDLGWGEVLRERFVWSRSFAGTRVKDASLRQRLFYAAFSPALLPLLLLRTARIAWSRGSFWTGVVPVLPILSLLFAVWSVGEAVGYLTGRAT